MSKNEDSKSTGIRGLVVSCVDYRLVTDDLPEFIKSLNLIEDADLVTLPGASLGATLDAGEHHDLGEAFDITYKFLKKVHGFTEVFVLDHRDCGMYKTVYGDAYRGDKDGELRQHVSNMQLFQQKMDDSKLGLSVRYFLLEIVPFGHVIKYEEITFDDKNITTTHNGQTRIIPLIEANQ